MNRRTIIFFIAGTLIAFFLARLAIGQEIKTYPKCLVTEVIDGDTFNCKYKGKQHRIRLRSVDTPEISFGKSECYGPVARDYLRDLLKDKEVRVETEGVGSYGRELGYVFLDDQFVNLDLVLKGYAKGRVIEYQQEHFEYDPWLFFKAQEIAEKQKFGMWGKCKK